MHNSQINLTSSDKDSEHCICENQSESFVDWAELGSIVKCFDGI